MRQALELALEALQFALHVGFPESSESQIKKGEKAYQQHRAAITAIKEALAQPEQEPVAWEQFYPDIGKPQLTHPPQGIYYTPPQRTWVGLTDEEMQDLWDRYAHMEMMRAIEAKLKDKNI